MDRDQLAEHLKFARELGVAGVSRDPAWRRRGESSPSVSEEPAAPLHLIAGPHLSQSDALAAVRADIGDCTRCKLHALGRRQIVFGVGNPDADLMFVGE